MSDFGSKSERLRSCALHAIALTAIAAVLSFAPAVHELNRRISDSYLRLQPRGAESPVLVVSIDDASLQRYGRWPWSRDTIARLIRTISAQQPAAIGVDILLSEPQSNAQDESLRSAIQQARRVVLVDKIAEFPDGPRWMEPLPGLAGAAAAVGHAHAVLDGDGLCRSFPPRELSLAGPRDAFSLEVVRQIDSAKVDAFLAGYGLHTTTGSENVLIAHPVLIPIAFRRDPLTTISAAEVMDGSESTALRGKVILVGFGAVEIGDRITTPVSRNLPTPGVEIHAQIVDSILAGRKLKPISASLSGLVLFALGFGGSMLFRLWRGWWILPALLAAGLTVYGIGFAAFRYGGVIAPIGTGLTVIALTPLMVYGVELAGVEASITRQMRLLQTWLAYRQSATGASAKDISWRLRVLTELQQELGLRFELYRTLLEATRDLVAVFDRAGQLLFANQAFNLAWGDGPPPGTIGDVRSRMVESKEAPLTIGAALSEGEATIQGELYSVRLVPLPATSLTPRGGTLLSMTNLHLRVERDRAREEALGFVTHELRTPLVAIQGFAEMMTRMPNAKASAQAPKTILRESRRLLALINSYLDVLRTDAGARPLRPAIIPVRKLILQVFDLMSPLTYTSDVQLTLNCEPQIFVQADEPLLTGAILNLVSNAIKYGRRGTEVQVSAGISGTKLQISVHNFGEPISDTGSVFDPFVRGSKDEDRQQGWGLGLALVKRIVDKHGGETTVQSNEAAGTTFTITIPGATAALEVSKS
ncbi:periplasmic sensor signal transduction histidine kinase [Candidatus Koribacter versatilis Ellin345]|uniref:histidine kinase n=1 Tax=Koribacter versatilis (strain Ellin345) TaxID=204669 RepID=Q1IUH1_KORVE|nr:CHASE2 domain-containing protein [Candidatus Koribacter versatilis]ABF39479.1 periplasmic sensor signal transduction histidine kinase [Candidatus Koribacter versatilis Ellin345]